MNKNSVLSFLKALFNVKYSCNTNIIRKRAIIGKTKELKILKFLTKEYHIFEKLEILKREKNKRISARGNTIAKMLFVGMFSRFKSLNQILEQIHKRKKFILLNGCKNFLMQKKKE